MNDLNVDLNEISKIKYFLLEKEYSKIQLQNKKTADKLYNVSKLIRKLQRRKRNFIKRLEEKHGDKIHLSSKKFAVEDHNDWTVMPTVSTSDKISLSTKDIDAKRNLNDNSLSKIDED